MGAFVYKNLDFSTALYKNLFFGAGAGRSRAFLGGPRAEIFYLEWEPEPKKNIWSLRAGAEEKWLGSATLEQSL